MNKRTAIVYISSIIAVVLFCLQLYVSNRLATMGAELSLMQKNTDKLVQNNEILENKIASYSSHMVIAERANELGFIRASLRYFERPPMAFIQQ